MSGDPELDTPTSPEHEVPVESPTMPAEPLTPTVEGKPATSNFSDVVKAVDNWGTVLKQDIATLNTTLVELGNSFRDFANGIGGQLRTAEQRIASLGHRADGFDARLTTAENRITALAQKKFEIQQDFLVQDPDSVARAFSEDPLTRGPQVEETTPLRRL